MNFPTESIILIIKARLQENHCYFKLDKLLNKLTNMGFWRVDGIKFLVCLNNFQAGNVLLNLSSSELITG